MSRSYSVFRNRESGLLSIRKTGLANDAAHPSCTLGYSADEKKPRQAIHPKVGSRTNDPSRKRRGIGGMLAPSGRTHFRSSIFLIQDFFGRLQVFPVLQVEVGRADWPRFKYSLGSASTLATSFTALDMAIESN
jgi:hypothetical protein